MLLIAALTLLSSYALRNILYEKCSLSVFESIFTQKQMMREFNAAAKQKQKQKHTIYLT